MSLRLLRVAFARSYSVLLFLAAWEAICRAGLVRAQLLPAPSAVAARTWVLLQDPQFLGHGSQTLLRLGAGLALATLLGVAVGLAATQNALLGRLVEPLVRVLAPIPKIALYPGLILLFGFGHASKITLVVADAAFPVLLATFHGARTVEPKLVWSARAAGTGRLSCVFRVILPAALPSILTGFRIALVISCVVVFLAEMISSTDGLGHLLIRAARSFRTLDMFVPLAVISALGLALNGVVAWARRVLLAGFPEHH